jgi:hypothetical protein
MPVKGNLSRPRAQSWDRDPLPSEIPDGAIRLGRGRWNKSRLSPVSSMGGIGLTATWRTATKQMPRSTGIIGCSIATDAVVPYHDS